MTTPDIVERLRFCADQQRMKDGRFNFLGDMFTEAADEIARRAAVGWQDISTAPKDGTPVRVLVESEVAWQEHIPAIMVAGGWRRTAERDRVIGWLPSEQAADVAGKARGQTEPPQSPAPPDPPGEET